MFAYKFSRCPLLLFESIILLKAIRPFEINHFYNYKPTLQASETMGPYDPCQMCGCANPAGNPCQNCGHEHWYVLLCLHTH
jgi:hypothetical protein